MNHVVRDVFNAVRGLSRQPAFALLVGGTLALGIGANTAIFSLINAALFRPLAIADEDTILFLSEARSDRPQEGGGVSYPDFADWRSRAKSFSSMAIVSADEATLVVDGRPARVPGAVVSADLFVTLGVAPVLGRAFEASEDFATGSEGLHPVMLTHSAWKNRFREDPSVIGRTLTVDGARVQIVGVTPPGLFPLEKEPIEFWSTVAVNGDPNQKGSANASRGYRAYAGALARLAPNVTLEEARAELDAINRAIREAHPDDSRKIIATAMPLREVLVGDAGRMLWLLQGVVLVVLLIACVNVANLLLARSASRQRDVAIRSALGASAWDIARQTLAESLVLASGGGVAGLLLSVWMVRGIAAFLPEDVPRLTGLLPDARVLLFTAGVALATALLCGVLPAFAAGRGGVTALVREGGARGGTGALGGRVRAGLVVSEVALAMTLLVAAGLLVSSLIRLNRVQPGYETGGTLTAELILSGLPNPTGEFSPVPFNRFLDALTERVRALPGVSQVSHAQSVPLTGVENNTSFNIVERPVEPGDQKVAQLRFVGVDYFDLLRIPVKAGRPFRATDDPRSAPVAMVNQAFVASHFGGENPLGRHVKMGWGGDEPKEIVGVVGDVRHRSLSDTARPEMYVPQAQFPNAGVTLLVRTRGTVAPESLIAPITAEIHALEPGMPLGKVKSLEAWRAAALAGPRFNAALLGALSLLALLLAVVGLYGVMSYSVAQRAPEMGIRMAIGARARDVLRLILGESLRLVAAGAALGLMASFALTRLMASLLFEVSPADPWTLASIVTLLAAVATLACWLPARRATRVDPMTTLRCE